MLSVFLPRAFDSVPAFSNSTREAYYYRDIDLDDFMSIPTYKTLVSYPSKKISKHIMMLLRYSYLERIYDEASNELYLKVAPKGEVELIKYHKKHKYKFKEKQVKKKQLYAAIEKN